MRRLVLEDNVPGLCQLVIPVIACRNVSFEHSLAMRQLDSLRVGGYVQCVDDTWNVTEDGQQDVDEKVDTAATLEEDTERWEDDGENDLADVAVMSVRLWSYAEFENFIAGQLELLCSVVR